MISCILERECNAKQNLERSIKVIVDFLRGMW